MEKRLGTRILVSEEPSVDTVQTASSETLSETELADKIVSALLANEADYKMQAYQISMGDNMKTIVDDQTTAASVLNDVKNTYIPADNKQNIQDVGFIENVTVDPVFVSKSKIIAKDDAVKQLMSTTEEKKTYTVTAGDTLYGIAAKNNIGTKELLSMNPDLQENSTLKIGQVISLMVPKTMVSVRTTEKTVYAEPVGKSVVYQYDNTKYKNYRTTVQNGKDGSKEVTANVVRVNGLEQSKEVVAEKVIDAPINKIITVGTKEIPPKQATGNFRMPVSGTITSPFGSRWGSLHTGIDIAVPTGTSVAAADGGMVIFAGWENGYGNLVKIDHGNGFVTYYGHNSKLYVSAGQKVAKGELISASGSTGNSTGPHVHFEIRKNGVAVNPMNYV